MKERLIESFCDYVPGIAEIGKFNLGFLKAVILLVNVGLCHLRI